MYNDEGFTWGSKSKNVFHPIEKCYNNYVRASREKGAK